MTSDEQRRAVAARLRGLRGFEVEGKKFCSCYDVEDALGLEGSIMCSRTAVETLADLIDRPTCELDHIDTDPAQDGYPLRLHECSNCRRLCYEIYGEFEYCPHCGAEVQE